jgi:hypothetical protein
MSQPKKPRNPSKKHVALPQATAAQDARDFIDQATTAMDESEQWSNTKYEASLNDVVAAIFVMIGSNAILAHQIALLRAELTARETK